MEKEYFSKQTTNAVKGLFALLVLIHHVFLNFFQDTNSLLLNYFFSSLGYLSVSVFFFISGYGIRISLKKEKKYLDHFLKNRVLNLYCVCLVFSIIYTIIKIVKCGISIDIILNFFTLENIGYGWYFQTIILQYLFFYIVYKYLNNCYKLRYSCLIIFTLLYCAFCWYFKLGSWRYVSVFAMVFGMYWAEIKEKIIDRINIWWLISSVLFFTFVFVLRYFYNKASLSIFCSLLFAITFGIGLKYFSLNSALLVNIGKISLEIYASQNIFINLFLGYPMYYSVFVFVLTFLFSIAVHPLIVCFSRRIRKQR